jgi:hypothetical protein
VPVPFRQKELSYTQRARVTNHDVDYWITSPSVVPHKRWVRVTRESSTYAVFFYATKKRVMQDMGEFSEEMFVEDVGDVLYIKLQNGRVVDADDRDTRELLEDVAHYVV